jgi:hypothetical protein
VSKLFDHRVLAGSRKLGDEILESTSVGIFAEGGARRSGSLP